MPELSLNNKHIPRLSQYNVVHTGTFYRAIHDVEDDEIGSPDEQDGINQYGYLNK